MRVGLMMRLLVALMLTFTASCCATGGASLCGQTSPILISEDDQMTTDTERQILAWNRKWEAQCAGSR